MHVPYQQKTVQDTGTSSARNTYFDNRPIHGGPKKVTGAKLSKNRRPTISHLSLPIKLDLFVRLKYQSSTI